MDDVLAAVDAHVSAHLLEKCVTNPAALGRKTRILVTHHLEATPLADMIVVVDNGKIAQQGTYTELKEKEGIFRTLLEEYGQEKEEEKEEEEVEPVEKELNRIASKKKDGGYKLMMDEERNTGSVSWSVYGDFFKAMVESSPQFTLLTTTDSQPLGILRISCLHPLLPLSRSMCQCWQYIVPGILVWKRDSWLSSRRLHGHLRCLWIRIGTFHIHRVLQSVPVRSSS